MKHYLVSRDGEEWSYGFNAEQLTSFLDSAPHDVTYTIKTVEDPGIEEDLGPHVGKSIDARRFETFDPINSWNEHR